MAAASVASVPRVRPDAQGKTNDAKGIPLREEVKAMQKLVSNTVAESASDSRQVNIGARENDSESLSLEEAVQNIGGARGLDAVAALDRMASGKGDGMLSVVEGGAIEAVCAALRPAAVGVWPVEGDGDEVVQMGLGEGVALAEEEDKDSVASLEVLGTDRTLWDVCIALLSRLCLFESDACRRIVDCEGLHLLVMAGRAGEPRETRLKALAALAAVGVWSGPHRAVEITSTPFLIETMCDALKTTQGLPEHLQGAIYDALVAMAHRHRAREIMKSKGCGRTFRAIAVRASVNGDYATAGKASVVAGHLSGHSIDEFGFLVENDSSNSTIDVEDALLTTLPAKGHRVSGSKSGGDQFSKSPDINKLRNSSCVLSGVHVRPVIVQNRQVNVAQTADLSASNEENKGEDVSPVIDGGHRGFDNGPTPPVRGGLGRNGKHRIPSNIIVDKSDDDPDADNDSPRGVRKKSRGLSPLQAFSQSAKNGIDGDFSALKHKSESQISREHKAASIWTDVLSSPTGDLQRVGGPKSRVMAYKRLATVPIPQQLRYKVWAVLLDVEVLRRRRPGLYRDMKDRAEAVLSPDSRHTIDVDVVRTMPSHSLFWAGGAAMGVDSLRSVLRAYAAYAPDVGYCQGMSSIAALLLMNAKDEEEAFLMLTRFMERYSYKKVFYPGFPQMQQWIKELKQMCEHYCPAVMRRLESENVSPELYMDKWLLTALTHNFPHRHVLRIWDIMFLGGSPKVILKACLGVLCESEARLRAMRFEEMMPFLQKTFADPEDGVLSHANPEPFLLLIRGFRFKPVVDANPGRQPRDHDAAQNSRRRRLRACFSSCFRERPKDD